MKRFLTVAALLGAMSAPAHALFMGGVEQTFGKDDYKGTNVHAGVNLGAFSVTPEYRRWSDKNSNGGFNTGLVRVGLDTRWVGVGATAGATARHAMYSNIFGGADVAFTISPMGEGGARRIGGPGRGSAPTGKGLARVDFGGGVLRTHHKQDASAATTAASVDQTDLHGFAGVSFLNVLLSGRLGKSLYSKDLKTAAVPLPQYEPVAGHLFSNVSFPDTSLNLGAEFTMLPMVAPYASFTHTRYKQLGTVQPGDTRAYTAGLRVGLEMLLVTAAFQHVSTNGAKDANFTNISAGLRF
ncbi:MAG: hypothetical protein WCU88_13705 [Elusimicrobiota bacterium]